MLKPIGHKIVVERTEEETKTKSGIILTESATEKPAEGTVVAIGNGRLLDNGERAPIEVSIGERVVFGKFSGTEVKQNDKEYLILDADEVLAVIE
ncbi:co-chaperone GroES [Abyssicoccus albus]|uniref:co-chaperone GroES n=1 Tax=Abyssicoccus albus TaxID=1817405 RepID=UPI00097E2874|nr:co-chaperone GroES [Abyssicoccus albus]AQL55759.1 co-chaperone GroES [Abyssicoccus albus]